MQQETPQPGYKDAFVEVAGARMHYLHAGSGKPMLLIHGLVGSSANWRNNIDVLAQHASVYAIDLVNVGRSQRPGGLDPTLKATANRVVAFMNALNLADADIVAHSHGGSVALMLAALHPKRVRRLILFAPANPYSRSSDLMVRVYSTRWGGVLARMLPYMPTLFQRIALGEMYGGAHRVPDKNLQDIVDGLRKPGTLRHVLCIIRCWFAEMAKLRTALRRVKWTPTLLVWGDHDCTVSLNSGIQLSRKLRNSELVVLRDGGHSVFEQMAEQSNRIVLEWLDSHPLMGPALHDLPGTASPARPATDAIVTQPLSAEA
jgi:4,5:9,10-diseco-3-hydroxy-5,9,17-trioxoandrosta-1(10),2-diene-4-oate hydrolase